MKVFLHRWIAPALLILPAAAPAQNGLRDIPDPDPAVEQAGFKLPPGVKINLFASDPMISKPVQMNWDSAGRLWLVSSGMYPHIEPFQEEQDRVLVLEDRDRDGVAETCHTYAGGLHIPTAVIPGDGGAYVANSTEVLFLPDADGDLRADGKQVRLSGFGTEDTHHLIHTFRHGPDGMLYFNQSIYIHSHVETPWGVRRLMGGGIWHYRPETERLDVFAKGLINPWGFVFDEWGQCFATDGAGSEGINFVFPRAVYRTSPGATRIVSGLNPGSPKHCGLEILSSPHVPKALQGQLLAPDFRGHRINAFRLERDGSTYRSIQQPDLVASTHRSFRPIDVRMGPDGAVYIADWYNPIIQHGEVDFRDERRDHVHGRIWRLTFEDQPLAQRTDIGKASNAQLLELLTGPDRWHRHFAQRELRRRGAATVMADLETWETRGNDRAALEKLWLYQALNQSPPELPALVRQLFTSAQPMARAAALRAMYHQPGLVYNRETILAQGIRDADPMVRLWTISVLAQLPQAGSVDLALYALDQPVDQHVDFALWSLVREHETHWVDAFQDGRFQLGQRPAHLLFAVRAVGKNLGSEVFFAALEEGKLTPDQVQQAITHLSQVGSPAQLERLLKLARKEALRVPVLNALAEATRLRKMPPVANAATVLDYLTPENPAVFSSATTLCGLWKLEAARKPLETILRQGKTQPDQLRATAEAYRLLDGGAALALLEEIAQSNQPPRNRAIAVAELVKLAPARAAAVAVQLLQTREDGQDVFGIFETFIRNPQASSALAKALDGATLPQGIAITGVQRATTSGKPSQDLVKALQTAGQLKPMTQQLSATEMAALVERIMTDGNPKHGEQVYRRAQLQCVICHAIGGNGGLTGPDLVSIGASAPVDYLVDSLLLPTKKIKEGYHTTLVTTKGGDSYAGGLHEETDRELVIRDNLGTLHRIPKTGIAQKQISPISMMPAGLTATLREDEFVDLVRFLSELGKEGPFKVQPTNHIRSFSALMPHERVRDEIGHYGAKIFAEDFKGYQWLPFVSKVDGSLPVEEIPAQTGRGMNRWGVLRFDVEPKPGQALALNDTTLLHLFAGEREIQLPENGEATVPLPGSATTYTLAVNHAYRKTPLEIRIVATAPKPKPVAAQKKPAGPRQLRFEAQLLHKDNIEGCAVGDLNGDGKPDVVAGERFYLNPDWKPHLFRKVLPFGADYMQDNGDHLWDVDGDGDPDVISGQFTETKVHWFENPGAGALETNGKPWNAHLLVDTETGRNEMTFLRDLTGDGTPEWIENSWNDTNPLLVWHLEGTTLKKSTVSESGNGHGQGFGDINGDGREDIVFKQGWYERPAGNPWGQTWTYHDDFTLPHASCPVLVVDLNQDGRADMIWGDGHNYGLYWEEQLRPRSDGTTLWRRHLIDQKFSQAHALAWEDLDNDGSPELITGKRYYAHSGRDPGAEDPIVINYYQWNPNNRTFQKFEAHKGEVGTGLQIRVADLNDDGWKDIVVPGKSGTHILWNRGFPGQKVAER